MHYDTESDEIIDLMDEEIIRLRRRGLSARHMKRVMDLTLGTAMAVVALPLILVLAAAQALALRCWPFFVQERIGTGGRPRHFPKIRTMAKSAPAYALKTDTEFSFGRLARILRAAHIDELPQLLLVPVGQLSLVGPRPKMPHRFEPACDVYAASRVAVPQGCTGLWQISEHRDGLPQEAPQYDVFYLHHASVRMDLWILWRTFGFMTRLMPAITLSDVPAWTMANGFCEPHARAALPAVPAAERDSNCLAAELCPSCLPAAA